MKINKAIRKFGYLIFLMSFILSVFYRFVYAQEDGVSIPSGEEGNSRDIFLHIFPPTTIADLKKYGVLRFLGYIAVIIIGVLLIQTIFVIIKTAMEFVQDESKDLKDALKSSQTLWQGLIWAFAAFFAYAGISIFVGTGNMFQWVSKLYQCNTEILFRAEYRAAVVNPDLFKDEVMIYCCSNLERTSIPEEGEGEGKLNLASWYAYTDMRNIEGVGVGSKEKGGWLFIADPNGKGPNVIPFDVKDAQGCEEFTV